MSKKTTGKARKQDGTQQPTPSVKKQSARTAHPPKSDQQRVNTKGKRKRKKNEISLEGNTNYGDRYNAQDGFDVDAEDYLRKKPRESALHYSMPLPPAKAPISPYRRWLKRFLFYALTIIIVVTVGLILSFTVFFKIDAISVEGETRYPQEDIIAASMIQEGENFFLCNTSPGERKIWEEFPYIESVEIGKLLFNKIVIKVKEAVPTSVVESEGSYVLLSESGKIIDIANKRQADVPIVMGAVLAAPTLSSSVKYQDENVEEYLEEILAAAEEYKFGVLKVIDITKLSNITVETKDGLHIILGKPENINQKMMTARKIMKKDVPEGDVGTLDVSLSASEGGKSYFSSKKSEPEPSQTSETSRKPEASQTSRTPESSGQTSEQTSEESLEVTSEPIEESSADTSEGSADESSEPAEESSDNSEEPIEESSDNSEESEEESSDNSEESEEESSNENGETREESTDDSTNFGE